MAEVRQADQGDARGPRRGARAGKGSGGMTWRDAFALGVAGVAATALGALFILPAIYPTRTPLGYLPGQILSYEVTVTKLGGTRGTFTLRLDRGETVRVEAEDGLVPGDRVCIRAVQRGDLVEGFLVQADWCALP